MAQRSVSDRKEVLQPFAEHKVSRNKPQPCDSKLHEDKNPSRVVPNGSIDELTAGILNLGLHNTCGAIKSRLTSGPDIDSARQWNQDLAVSSPTYSGSTASSPGTLDNIWDSPKTPYGQSNSKSAIEAVRPFTPLSTYSVTAKQTTILTPSKSLASTSTIFQKIEARIGRSIDQEVERCIAGQEEDDCVPKKLIRGLTAEFLASKSCPYSFSAAPQLTIISRKSQCYGSAREF